MVYKFRMKDLQQLDDSGHLSIDCGKNQMILCSSKWSHQYKYYSVNTKKSAKWSVEDARVQNVVM